jgi:uncharacterized membrane protein YedE/YeeE
MSAARASSSFVGLLSGGVFALGLYASGMTDPGKVLAFLDFFGHWDPSLAFVMVGAIAVHFAWLRFSAQTKKDPPPAAVSGNVDTALLLGAALFGVGWGMSGYCPGPALVAAGFGRIEAWVFVSAMACGMATFNAIARRQTQPAAMREPS